MYSGEGSWKVGGGGAVVGVISWRVERGEWGGGGIVSSPCAAGEGAGLVVRAGGDGEGPDVPVVEAWWGMCVCQSG